MKMPGRIPGWLARPLLIAVCFVAALVSGWYGPLVTASLWRVFNPGGRVRYHGLLIQVPWPWISDFEEFNAEQTVSPQGFALRRMPRTLFHRLPPQSIFITVISAEPGKTPEQQTMEWLDAFREAHPGASFLTANQTETPAGASCLKAANPATPDDAIWTCISPHGGWVANLEGHPRDEETFFAIVSRLRR
jgi:hypothetical protein